MVIVQKRGFEIVSYPAAPDSKYGWEKLFSERMYLAYHRNHGLAVRIARFHNIFGPEGAWNNGREKAPAALCRKVAEAEDGTSVLIWGDSEQTQLNHGESYIKHIPSLALTTLR